MLGKCEYLNAICSHDNGVFPLGGEGMIFGDNRPTIGQFTNIGFARIDHRLDRENHALLKLESTTGPAVM